jgi:hypothetical protein
MKRSDLEHILRASKKADYTGGAVGWCLEPHDLAFSKLAARREKDLDFVSSLLKFKMVRPSHLRRLIESAPDDLLRDQLLQALEFCMRRRPLR